MFNIFKRKKEKELTLPKEPGLAEKPLPEPVLEKPSTKEDVKPQLDLILARIDNLKIQYDALNERLNSIEKMIKEIYEMAKS